MPNVLAQSEVMSPVVGTVLFYLFAAMSAGGGLAVVFSRNIVRCAVALLFTLLGVAGLFFLLNAEFLAAVQLVVYVGGTLILIVFGVMLTTRSANAIFDLRRSDYVIAIGAGIVLLGAVILALPIGQKARDAGQAFPTDHPLPSDQPYPMMLLGQKLLGDYLLPFELSSVLLLAVMIGAAYLARARKRSAEPTDNRTADLSRQARQWS